MTNRLTSNAITAALAASLALGGAAGARAQSAQEHGAHHPGGSAAQATPAPAPAPGPAQQQRGTPGMMGGQGTPMPGMQGGMPGTMGSQGMPMPGAPGGQQGGMPGMMGGDMGRMMEMMHRMMAARGMMGGPGAMRHFERIDAHLAYVRTLLRITDAQAPQWNAFADASRAAADKLRQAYAQAMQAAGQPATAPALLERRIALLSAQLEAMRTFAAATQPLYTALSDEQKRAADELLAEHLRDMRRLGL
ncbi:Spy/CpxP family protein refolding chaperone [Siccirubricoccus phaeus]|uniref:Spy/CpxP family protein refolding chaperone n=1 Tax=Siccirubricoccus phaeus TaxID=2595053 RepID=UPI0011F28D4D|nr:Spy/CpxP family protein refolding chaperone [Siccirubricoccus phaeus]